MLLELEAKTSEIQSDVLFHKAYHSEYFQKHALWLIKKSGLKKKNPHTQHEIMKKKKGHY